MTRHSQTAFRFAFGTLVLVAIGLQFRIHLTAGFSALNFFSYFTNLSNIIAALVFLAGAARQLTGAPVSRAFDALRTAAAINMVVVGVVFALLLRNVDLGTLQPWVNTVVHFVMPVAVIAELLLWPPSGRATTRQLALLLCFPVAYLVYVLARGAATGWYPYPFLNPVTMNGYGSVVPYVIGIMILFLFMAWLLTRLSARVGSARGPDS